MCDKAILEMGGTLESVLDCNKNKGICSKAVDKYLHALEFVANLLVFYACFLLLIFVE